MLSRSKNRELYTLLKQFNNWLRFNNWFYIDVYCWAIYEFDLDGEHYTWNEEDMVYYSDDSDEIMYMDFPLRAYN